MGLGDAHHGPEQPPTRPAESGAALPSQKKCSGLRADAVDDDVRAADSFQRLCRVLDSKFSHVSAEILFTLRVRAAAADADAVVAFDRLVGPEAARLFQQVVEPQLSGVQYHGFGDVALADMPLAQALVAEARRIDANLGGLYEGRLDHLRSTLCNPAFGVNASGCCAACFAIRRDFLFVQRLRRSVERPSAGAAPVWSSSQGTSPCAARTCTA